HPGRTAAVVNAQVALDTVSLVAILHFGGGLTSLGVLFFAPAFFAYGAVLPLPLAFVHVALATLELALLGVGELGGMVGHLGSGGFYRPDAYREWGFVAMVVMAVTTVDALCAYLSHYLSGLLGEQEERSRALAAARADLLARNEREAARVRVLLDVAQHVSAMHTVEALLRAVCDTTVALVRVPRVEIFLWDAERQGLRLAAAHGLDVEPDGAAEVRYTADLPIIGRLRAGEVVQFGAGPSHALVSGRVALPFRRGFAAPMVCRDSFEGALFVGYDEEDAGGLIDLVQGIARQAALALVNVRTMEQQQQDAEVSRVLLSLSHGRLDRHPALPQRLGGGLHRRRAAPGPARHRPPSAPPGRGPRPPRLDRAPERAPGRRPGGRRPAQVGVRVDHVARAAHAAQRDHRLHRDAPRGGRRPHHGRAAGADRPPRRARPRAARVDRGDAARGPPRGRPRHGRDLRRANRRPPQGAAREHRRPAARARGGLRVGDARGPRPAHHDRSRQGLARGPQSGEQRLQVHQRGAGAGAPEGAKRCP